MMRRREFITLLGGSAVAWPFAVSAQTAGKQPTIGYIGGGGPITQRAWVEAFVQRLRELGWIEGRTIAIEYRWGEGRAERYAEIAAEFVRLNVDVILAGGTEVAIAAKQATLVIPIVLSVAGDPIGSLLVASLARPGGNVTGRARAATRPRPTGSASSVKTIGMTDVACFITGVATPDDTMTSTLSRTNSAAASA